LKGGSEKVCNYSPKESKRLNNTPDLKEEKKRCIGRGGGSYDHKGGRGKNAKSGGRMVLGVSLKQKAHIK